MECNEKNQLIREGLDRPSRALASLSPDQVEIDDRRIQDLLLFAKRYASFLKFRNLENRTDGTWKEFMEKDISLILAELMTLDIFKLNSYLKKLYSRIRVSIEEDSDEAQTKKHFGSIFDLLFTLAKIIDDNCSHLDIAPEVKGKLISIIEGKLNAPFGKLYNLRKQIAALGEFENNDPDLSNTDLIPPIKLSHANRLVHFKYFNTDAEDLKINLPESFSPQERISYVINHNLFNSQVSEFLGGIATLVNEAAKLLENTLTAYPKHEPYYGLFITFLKLFGEAQKSLNAFTKNHLDFYYHDILNINKKIAQPDYVFLVSEIQKHLNEHLIRKGVLFLGGKDDTEKEREFALLNDVVVDHASIRFLKAYQNREKLYAFEEVNNIEDTNSTDKAWFPFGNPDDQSPTTMAGFAIASNILFLKEGKRKIILNLQLQPNSLPLDKLNFIGKLSGEKGWFTKDVNVSYNRSQLTLVIELEAGDPPVIPYSRDIHEKNFNSHLPMLLMYVDQITSDLSYKNLVSYKIHSVAITVRVKGVNDLALSNDYGPIDSSISFKPFGDFPKKDSNFYIGSNEIFQKRLMRITFNFDKNLNKKIYYLTERRWEDLSGNNNTEKPNENNNSLIDYSSPELDTLKDYLKESKRLRDQITPDFNPQILAKEGVIDNNYIHIYNAKFKITPAKLSFFENPFYRNQFHEGFLKITLEDDKYSLEKYTAKLFSKELDVDKTFPLDITLTRISHPKIILGPIRHVLRPLNPSDLQDIFKNDQNDFSIPEISMDKLSIDYTANSEIRNNNDPNHQFFQLTPFGYYLPEEEGFLLAPNITNAGELLIGIEDARKSGSLNLLFILAEGSSDPNTKPQEVLWFYLNKNNKWSELEVTDGTKKLTRSGIVNVKLPNDIGTENYRLPSGYIWIKVAVAENPHALCEIISVHTQGAVAKLVQDISENKRFRKALAKGTITKLKSSDAAIKSISQPDDSFDGIPDESEASYYTRVSERLRHKNRASSIWDFEHLIIEKFPSIYKVKCINHSGFLNKEGNDRMFCENLAGHVTIVCIPDIKNKAYVNPLRPTTSIRLLDDITSFLTKIKNPLVTLHVVNPLFESIQFKFNVKFSDGLEEAYYKDLLNTEIEQYLSPWAHEAQGEIVFGRKVYKSRVIQFVENREYVSFISDFKMDHYIQVGNSNSANLDLEEIEPTSSRSILVSYYDDSRDAVIRRHRITTIESCHS